MVLLEYSGTNLKATVSCTTSISEQRGKKESTTKYPISSRHLLQSAKYLLKTVFTSLSKPTYNQPVQPLAIHTRIKNFYNMPFFLEWCISFALSCSVSSHLMPSALFIRNSNCTFSNQFCKRAFTTSLSNVYVVHAFVHL